MLGGCNTTEGDVFKRDSNSETNEIKQKTQVLEKENAVDVEKLLGEESQKFTGRIL